MRTLAKYDKLKLKTVLIIKKYTMDIQQIGAIIIGIVISIIAYFMKATMDEIKVHREKLNSHDIEIKVLENNHNSLNNRMDELFDAIKELSIDIKGLTRELSKKKDL